MNERINKILSFLELIEKYKLIERKIVCSNHERMESDAEHSWHLAMFVMLFEKELPEHLDHMKMMKIALMHDLVEVYAGDTFAFDTEARESKKEREMVAAKKLFSQLPEDLGKDFMQLFEEYENVASEEAAFIKSFDKIQPIIQNICSKGVSWKKYDLKAVDLDNYKRKHMVHSDFVLNVYEKVLNEAKNRKLLD